MKKKLQLIFLIMLTGLMTRAQISGSYDIPGATYPTIASAIDALNVAGVGTGGVTFNIAAGYTETFPTTTSGLITMGNGTAANPIVFQKSGTGANPVITAATPGLTTRDGIIFLKSATYVTFDGIDLKENPANITIGTQNALTEIGYGVVKASADLGSQNNTIQNCEISLYFFPNTLNFTSYAVYQRHLSNVAGTNFIYPTVPAGTHSYNTYSGLRISNCTNGIYLEGSGTAPAPYTLYDQNNTATGNTITLAGSNTNLTYGYGIYVKNTNNLTVTNNVINGNVSNGNVIGTWVEGKAINVEFSYNTFTLTYTGAVRVYGFYARDLAEGTNNLTNFHHNTVSGVTMGAQTGASAFYPMQFGVGARFNIYNNVVTNNTLGSATEPSNVSFFGFAVFRHPLTGYSTEMNVYNNEFSGNTVLSSTTQTTNYQLFGLYDYNTAGNPAGPAMNVYNNIIENNSVKTSNMIDGIYAWNNSRMNIHDNIIRNNQSWGHTNGFKLAGQKNDVVYEIYNNKVYNLTSNGTAETAMATGVNDVEGGASKGKAYYYNNFISDLKAPASISPKAVVGFFFAGANTSNYLFYHYLYNNTVYLDALCTSGGPFGSSGVYSASLKTLEMKNNIIVNKSAQSGTGKTVAFKMLGSLNASNYTQASNNNLFYAGIPGPDNLIFADDGKSDQTLAKYKQRVYPRDNASVTEIPPFANVTTTPYDLHLLTTVQTECESGGLVVTTPVAVSTDIDLDPRYPNPGYPNNPLTPATAPDIGADEFGGLIIDKQPPMVSFTVLKNTSLLTGRILTTSIEDRTGVPTSGIGLPRLYWKINAGGLWHASTANWVSGTTYTFTLGSGVALSDSVYYYIAVQDTKSPPNVGSTPPTGSGYTANPPACSTPPSNSECFSYKIVQGLCGTYTVGVGKDYPTITAAVAAISGKDITCPVVFQLTDATYASETLPINVGNYDYEGASAINTITIRPAPGVDATITGNSTTAVFKLTRTNYFILDGSNNGNSGRNLTISNTATTGTTAVIWIASSGIAAGTYGNVVKNCNIKNGYNTAGSLGIFVGSGTGVGTAGHDNDNLTIENNALSKASFAIYAISDVTGLIDNLVIKNNIIGSNDATSYVVNRGIVLQGATGAQVAGNEIFNLIPAANGQEKTGIELKDNVTNTLIKENMIHDFYCPAGFAGSSIGIHINTSNMTANNTTIVNNLIYNLTTSNFNATHLLYNPFGIRINGGTGHKLYHNTVRMTGTQATYSTNGGSLSAALLVLNLASITEMKDNIFTNDIVGLTGSRSFCIYMDKAVNVWILSSDYNDLYPSGPYGLCGMYSPASNVEINCPTLADWQTASGMDAHSKSVDPVFTSATSLVPTTTLMPHAGIYIPDFPTDFANVTRTNPPDIGAYEYSLSPLVVTTAASEITSTTAVLNGTINPQGLTVDGYFEYGLTTEYGNSVATTPATVTGNTAVPVSASLSGLLPNTTYHFRAKGVDQGGLIVFGSDQTFTTVESTEAEFLSFAFNVAENPILTADVSGTIDPATFTITLDVLEYVSLSSLVATFTLSDLATASIGGVVQVSGVTSNNFTNPVVYTVTAEAGNTQNWTVNVTALTCTCPWNYVVTGSIHTINIPLAAAPEVFGVPLAPDDWIGIFFLNDNGEETCGGAVQWTGTGNVAIIAYGNDPTTPEKDGFASGETFRWRLSQCGNPIDYTAAATYDPTMPNQGNFAGFGLSKLTSLKAAYIQYFTLNQGWNGMSGYLVPIDPAVQNMFAPIVNKLTILGNLTSVYWPSQGVNTIGNWNSNSGYAAKITENVDFMILGGSYAPSTMTVPAGWSYLPVHSQCEANVMEMFGENLSKVVIIQDLIGTNVFWPAMGIYTLQNFEPGKAYKIKLTNAVTVTFPECSTKSVTKVTSTDNNIETVWGNLNMTPNTQVSLFMSEVTGNLIEGDVIGAFDQEGHIYGYLALSGEKENQAMTLFGDDNSLAEKEGFVNGESVSYKLFRTSTGETYDLEVFYSAVLENTSGNFEAGSFAAISGLKLGATGVENLTGSSTGIYPNPTSEIVNITGITSTTQVRIFNVFGEEVFFTELSTSSAINVASLQKGMYVIKISNENGEKLNKLIIR